MLAMTRYLASALLLGCALAASAQTPVTLPLWPHGTPEPPQTTAAEANVATAQDIARAGHAILRYSNVTVPTMTVYTAPPSSATGMAALVFPGGGYQRLAWDIEGQDTCQWLNSIGVTCLIVKYRVPEAGYYPENPADLEDAQQAMRLARLHAAEWHINPAQIGVIGFSAGGNLTVLMSTHSDDAHVLSTPAAADVPMRNGAPIDARPAFAMPIYPAYLATPPEKRVLIPTYTPNALTPPTFIATAEDDRTYGQNSLVYYRALMDAHIPAELHMFPSGGHGFGTFPAATKPVAHWTDLATAWLRSLKLPQ